MEKIFRNAPEYPQCLLELRAPPPWVCVEGDVSLLGRGPRVCVVGSRAASDGARMLADTLGRELSRAGAVVVSGGALGIDAHVHRGAVAEGGACVVVLPSDVRRPVPASNRDLFRAILKRGGLLLSEYETTPAGRFPYCARNRILAALSECVVVVQARRKSGTSYTVAEAQRLRRPLYAYPWAVSDLHAAGGLDLLRGGARVVTGASDVLRLLGYASSCASGAAARDAAPAVPPESGGAVAVAPSSPPSPAMRVLEVLRRQAVASPETLAHATGLSASQVLGILSELEMAGQVRAHPSGAMSISVLA
ncbi:MAG: DNA-processing protein DprA [Deltaproteobacteria bacterium]|nr:DNA-processing protein DprA [Deltaproteobacteria bacterium]